MRVNGWPTAMLVLLGVLSLPGETLAVQVAYKGYTIETGMRNDDRDPQGPLSRVYGQIDIIESVNLPPAVTNFFKQKPIIIDSSIRQPGEYLNGRLLLKPEAVDNIHPVALHEYLHALHFERIGLSNADIRNAYKRATEGHYYPDAFRRAHFLENEKEYFAVIGTIYLFKTIQQPPYSCSLVKQNDRLFVDYLSTVLGKHSGCD